MIKLNDARVTGSIPKIVAEQDWAKAFSEAFAAETERTLKYAEKSKVFTTLDEADSEILDAIAVCMNVDWYDPDMPLETKRNIIKTALPVRKTSGTVAAVKKQVSAIYPNSEIAEWFQYDGTPGNFRIAVNISEAEAATYTTEEMEKLLQSTKRYAAHLESVSYLVKHGFSIDHTVQGWKTQGIECGTIRCGQAWTPSEIGYTAGNIVNLDGGTNAFEACQPISGQLPNISTLGTRVQQNVEAGGNANAYGIVHPFSGTQNSGQKPVLSTAGETEQTAISLDPTATIYTAKQPFSGIIRCGQV